MESLDLSNDLEGSTPLPPLAEEQTIKKNVNKTIKMDSTPINDVMSGPADWETQSQMGGPPPQQFMMNQQPQMMTPPPAAPKSNPLNLTDEQMTALIVGVAAALASSKMVQEKLASMIPQVGSDPHGMIALGATGLVAALIFYFAKRLM